MQASFSNPRNSNGAICSSFQHYFIISRWSPRCHSALFSL